MPEPLSRPPLRVAIAGLGFGAAVHLPALRDCPRTKPVALWHPRQERLDGVSRQVELPGFTDFEAMLADPGVRLPGERRRRLVADAQANGISVPEVMLCQLRDLAGAATG